jgi:hypothetical protein
MASFGFHDGFSPQLTANRHIAGARRLRADPARPARNGPVTGVLRPLRRCVGNDETDQIGWAELPDDLILTERASLARVSKDGRWHDLICGRPSRRAQQRAPLDEADAATAAAQKSGSSACGTAVSFVA